MGNLGDGGGGCRRRAGRVVADAPGEATGRTGAHATHNGYGPGDRSSSFAGWKAGGVCFGSEREREPEHLGAAGRRRRADPSDTGPGGWRRAIVLTRRHKDRISFGGG